MAKKLNIQDLIDELDPDLIGVEFNEEDDTEILSEDTLPEDDVVLPTELEDILAKLEGSSNSGARRIASAVSSRVAIAERAKNIKREAAYNSEELAELVSRKQLNELIKILTQPETDRIENNLRHIEAGATKVLKGLIPPRIMATYRFLASEGNTTTMPRTPGFIFKLPPAYGPNYDFWITPDIPMYLKQHTEQALILERNKSRYNIIQKQIIFHYKYVAARAKLEMKLASQLFNVYTRYDLLMKNPDYYKVYMDNKLYNL